MHTIKQINTSFSISKFDKALYIVVHNPDNVPPHLILFNNKKYYSLSFKKQTIAGDANKLLHNFLIKKTPLLFIKLKSTVNLNIEAILSTHFKKYSFAGDKNSTCLTPIKQSISSMYGIDIEKINFIYELIPFLEEQNLIETKQHLFLENEIKNGTYFLKNYNNNDILKKIEFYKSTYGGTYTN